ncbi:MAG: BrnA antitoxin family protein [Methylococcaceae bacterium]|nr:BrnA antitoxin family protein [Methylococcaceae bacterium]
MRKDKNITSYTANELKKKRAQSLTDWGKVDAMTDNDLEEIIAADDDERDFVPDWTKAELVLPESKLSVNLRLDRDIVDFFKRQGRGHISRMQAVLKAYVDAHQHHAK